MSSLDSETQMTSWRGFNGYRVSNETPVDTERSQEPSGLADSLGRGTGLKIFDVLQESLGSLG
jgi:hypothetical protein